jgi:hypothetical protein
MSRRWIRRLIPAAAISAVLTFSYFTPVPAFVGNQVGLLHDATGYHANGNCGVHSTGYHDHGKPCPPNNPHTFAAANFSHTSSHHIARTLRHSHRIARFR